MSLKNRAKFVIDVFILFSFVFAFNVPFLNKPALILVIPYVLYIVFIENKGRVLIHPDKHLNLFLGCLFIVLIYSYFRFTSVMYDYSYFLNLLKLPVYMVFSFVIAFHLFKSAYSLKLVLVWIFALQSIIIITCFISPEINQFFNLFRSAEFIEDVLRKHGSRGLSISSMSFFGLAIVYALFAFYIGAVIKNHDPKYRFFMVLILSFFAVFTIGRIAYLGFLFSFFLLFFSSRKELSIVFILSTTILTFFSFYIYNNQSEFSGLITLLYYSFEFVFNFINKGELTTTSTSVLSQMYFPLNEDTILVGDGKYDLSSGAYYMHTDAGFMRDFLAVGIVSVFLYIGQILLNFKLAKNLTKGSSVPFYLVFVLLTALIFIFHFKGSVIGMTKPFYSLFFLIYFYSSFESKSLSKARDSFVCQ